MGLISHTIKSIVNGVSQQPPEIRLESQVDEQTNMVCDITHGLTRRNAVELKESNLKDSKAEDNHVYFSYKSLNGKTIVVGINSNGELYNINTNKIIKETPETIEYLKGATKEGITTVETDKKVYILNKAQVVKKNKVLNTNEHRLVMNPYGRVTKMFPSDGKYGSTKDTYFLSSTMKKWGSVAEVGGRLYYKGSIYKSRNAIGIDYANDPSANYVYLACDKVSGTGSKKVIAKVLTTDVHLTSETVAKDPTYAIHEFPNSSQNRETFYDQHHRNGTRYMQWFLDGKRINSTNVGGSGDSRLNGIGVSGSPHSLHRGSNYSSHRGSSLSQYAWKVYLHGSSATGANNAYVKLAVVVYEIADDDSFNNEFVAIVPPKLGAPRLLNMLQPATDTGVIDLKAKTLKVTKGAYTYDGAIKDSFIMTNPTGDIAYGKLISLGATDSIAEVFIDTVYTGDPSYGKWQRMTFSDHGVNIGLVGATKADVTKTGDEVKIHNHSYMIGAAAPSLDMDINGKKIEIYKVIEKATHQNIRSLVWINNVTNGVTYTISIKKKDSVGTVTEAYHVSKKADTSSFSTPSSLATYFSAELKKQGSLVSDISHKEGSILMTLDSAEHYYVTVTNDIGVDMIYATNEAIFNNDFFINNASILPRVLPDSSLANPYPFIVRVQSSASNSGSAYYLQYNIDSHTWKEGTLARMESLSGYTMPVIIDKTDVANIVIKGETWQVPVSGDAVSNKTPSFVGSSISDMMLYNSRLVLSSNDSLVFSQADDYTNFYRTTAARVLISDRIDIKLDSTKLGYSKIKNMFIVNGEFVVNTGHNQSVLKLTASLDMTKASFSHVSSYEVGDSNPIPVGNGVYLPETKGDYSKIRVFSASESGFYGDDLTAHVPKYIKGNVVKLINTRSFVILQTDYDQHTVYVQNYLEQGGKLVQNAWHKWEFELPVKYLYKENNEEIHFIFSDKDDKNFVKTSMDTHYTLPTPDQNILGYKPYLDFITDDLSLLQSVTAAPVVSIDSYTGDYAGSTLQPTDVSGINFESSVTFSEQVARDQQGTKIPYSRLMLRRFNFELGVTGRLTVMTTRISGAHTHYDYEPRVLGQGLFLNREAVSEDDLKLGISGRAEELKTSIHTKAHAPFNLIAYTWQGQFVARGGRI